MGENSRLGQLQVLYNARGRKIEELDRELKEVQESSARDVRILKHKLSLLQGVLVTIPINKQFSVEIMKW